MMSEELLSHLSEQRVTEILSDLIRRPTDTETGDYLIDFLTHCGISAEKQDCGEGRFNVIGRIPGSEGPGDLYIGHTDVVPAGRLIRLALPALFPHSGRWTSLRQRRFRYERKRRRHAPCCRAADEAPRPEAGADPPFRCR